MESKAFEANPFADHDLVLMQYTGLKDKNGKEIYEGDIVKDGWLKNNPLEVVEWSGTGFEPFADHSITEDYDPNTIEVIGNVYENPDLLADAA